MKRTVVFLIAVSVVLSICSCSGTRQQEFTDSHTNHFSQDNPYAVYYAENRSYLLPDSCSVFLCWSDISSFSKEEAYLAQQEIYAQYGQQFDDPYLTEYFSAQAWYSPSASSVSDQLSDQANMNLFLLEVYSAVQDNTIQNWDNPYIPLCAADYILPESSIRSLTAADLQNLTTKELVIARNEIFARHGYIFSDQDLRSYFYTKPWYRPSTLSRDFDFGSLSSLESANVQLIQKYEEGTPAAAPGGTQVKDPPAGLTVIDQYTYLYQNHCYHIPYVAIPAAEAINQEMFNVHYGHLLQEEFSNQYSIFLIGMYYTVGQKGDVVSVLVMEASDIGCDGFFVYNFSATTGRKLSDSEVFAAFGLTEATGRAQIQTALTAYWNDRTGPTPGDVLQPYIDKTLADSNVAAWKPYVDANGNLCFTGRIFSPAGAESYEHLLDPSGNTLPDLSCPIHG